MKARGETLPRSPAPARRTAWARAQEALSAGVPHPTVSAVLRVLPDLLPSVAFRDEETVGLLPAPEHCRPDRALGGCPTVGTLGPGALRSPKASRDLLQH